MGERLLVERKVNCLFRTTSFNLTFTYVGKIERRDSNLRRVRPSVHSSTWNSLGPVGRIFMKFDI